MVSGASFLLTSVSILLVLYIYPALHICRQPRNGRLLLNSEACSSPANSSFVCAPVPT